MGLSAFEYFDPLMRLDHQVEHEKVPAKAPPNRQLPQCRDGIHIENAVLPYTLWSEPELRERAQMTIIECRRIELKPTLGSIQHLPWEMSCRYLSQQSLAYPRRPHFRDCVAHCQIDKWHAHLQPYGHAGAFLLPPQIVDHLVAPLEFEQCRKRRLIFRPTPTHRLDCIGQ